MSSLESCPYANQLLLDKFKIQDDVATYGQFSGYDNFQRFGLSNEMELAVILKSVFGVSGAFVDKS